MRYTATRLEVEKGERIRVALFGSSWMITAAPPLRDHVVNELVDVGFRVLSLVDSLPSDPDWEEGKIDPPGFPQTLLWAELEASDAASLQLQMTEDLYVARAWPSPATSADGGDSSPPPLHPYAVQAAPPAIVEGRVIAFGVAYVIARAA